MPIWEIVVLSLYGLVVLATFLNHFALTAVLKRTLFFKPAAEPVEDREVPLVSIIVPAKDEEATIAQCLESLLGQDYPNLEIFVVDDRSDDRTAEIVRSFVERDERIHLEQVTELPPGWTGKTHALDQCQRRATGEYLLFVDADTRLQSSCVRVTVNEAIASDAAMVSMMPSMDSRTFWERVIQPVAGWCLMLLFPLPKINDPEQLDYGFANGQYILVRRDAYDQIGGHEAVKDKFVEDIHLGRRIRRAGLGLRVALGPELLTVRMYPSLSAILRGWSRIFYSAVDGRPGKMYGLLSLLSIFSGLSYVMLIGCGTLALLGYSCPFLWTMLGLGAAHQLFQSALAARVYGLSHSDRRYLVFRILAVGAMYVIGYRTIKMCKTGEVTWRGTTYGKELDQTSATA
ncbi:4,4'-diaponeurosporenoate glycosyltransferase [Planctomycetes bacterium Pan216]|uniref:4,4'-diaponeurosporenoate glycosyltransferase n=1 Tax=Kolteria novifilia TaxID=2527975 RepID=A0A518BA72_9BACT|nr:4,4'-diaponeurosporenoate glycosyltransferase [Planctomycetes bacterium Pan216]